MRRVSVPFSNSDAMQESFQDHFAQFDFGFTLTASKTALMIIDMQYASASRDMGMGRRLNLRGQNELGRYRFDRIEKTCVPTIQRLLQFFRAHGLRIIYLTIGSNLSDYMDMPQNLREVAAPRHSVWKLTVRIHNSSRARWGLWGTRYPELSTNPRGGV